MRTQKLTEERPLVGLLTNNDDDVYCFRAELLKAIQEAGYRLLISCPDGPKFEALEEEFDLKKERDFIYDCPKIDRRGTNPLKDGGLMLHYLALFRKHRPSVVLTYTAKPNVYASLAARSLKIPVINNVTGFGSVLKESDAKQKLIMGLFKTAYRKSACVMFQNSTNMELANRTGMVKGPCVLIPGSGVNVDRYPLQPYPEGGNGLEGSPVVFNYIGRIMHDKGVDDYIEAARRIRAKYPQTEFHMLGFIEPTESHYEAELKALGEAGIVIYHGSQKNVKPFITRSHCIIHPSTYGEGMSNVLLENASSGRPIITTDNPGCKETVEEGKSGYIYPGGDVDALVSIIRLFLNLSNQERQQMGKAGRNHAVTFFSRAAVIDAYLEQIKNLMHEG